MKSAAYLDGYDTFFDGGSAEDNPFDYEKDYDNWEEWLRGFEDAECHARYVED